MHELNPSYQLPNRKNISQSLIPAEFDKTLTSVVKLLSLAESVCLTTDTWTSKNTESYIAVTAHFIHEFQMHSILLSCEKLSGSHTSAHLAVAVKNIVRKFGLQDKVLVCVTDNASNIVGAIKDVISWKHFPCFAHTVNLIVNDGLDSQSELLSKIKSIVGYFKRSTTSSEILTKTQSNAGIKTPLKLLQSVETRWNSTYYMLQRFLELGDNIKMAIALLNSKNIEQLTTEEWGRCRDLSQILKPFEEISKRMCGGKYVTGSEVIVIVQGLNEVLEKLNNRITDTAMKSVVASLRKSLHDRLKNIEFSKTIGVATLLDPRYKLLPFRETPVAADELKKLVISYLEKIISKKEMSRELSTEIIETIPETTTLEPDDLSVWDQFDQLVTKATPKGTTKSKAIAELDRYLEEPYLKRKEDPLIWWQQNHHVFPTISELVNQRFNVLASSVPCERLFSKTGQIISDRRTRLSSKHVGELIFLNQNIK